MRDRFTLRLAAIAAGGLVLRVSYTVASRDLVLSSDGIHYAAAARHLADGDGFVNPLAGTIGGAMVQDAHHPPVWTLVLAGVRKAGFHDILPLQLTAAVVGVATIVMVGLAAREAFDHRTALFAAALAAVYPGIWLYERELVSEPIGLLLVTTILFLAYRFRRRPGPWAAVVIGAVLGVAALTRAELIVLGLFIVTPVILWTRRATIGRRVAWLAMAAGATIVVIMPWFAFNATRFSQPVALSAGLGATMRAGNCGQTYEGDRIGYYEFGCVLLTPGISADPSVADGQFRSIALSFIADHKAEFVKVAAIRVARTFSLYDPWGQRELERERGSPMWVLTAALLSFYVLVPFAVWGAVVARRRRVPIYPLLSLVVLGVLVVIPTIGAVRYRSVAEVSLVILAAAGIDALVRRREPIIDGRLDEPDPGWQLAPSDTPAPALGQRR